VNRADGFDEMLDVVFPGWLGVFVDARVIVIPEREHVTNGVPCWCNPDTSEDGLVIHRGGH